MTFKIGDTVKLIMKLNKYSVDIRDISKQYIINNPGILSKESIDYLETRCSGSVYMKSNELTIIWQDTKSPEYYICEYIDEYNQKVTLAFHEECLIKPIDNDTIDDKIDKIQKLLTEL